MGLRNLYNRKVRTILTIMGVFIGTMSIVVMISLGVGMDEANLKAVEQLGNVDIIDVSSWYYPAPDESGNSYGSQGILNDKAIAAINEFPEVKAATALMQQNYTIVSGKYKANWGQIYGIDPKYMSTFFELKEGRFLEENDSNVAVFGYGMPYNFYNTRSNRRDMYYYREPDMSADPPVDIYNDIFVMTSDWSYGDRKASGSESEGNKQKPVLHKFKGVGRLYGEDNVYTNQYYYSVIVSIDWLKKCIAEDSKQSKSQSGSSMSYAIYDGGRGVVSKGASSNETQYNNALVKVHDRKDVEAVVKKINDMGLGAYTPLEMLKYMEETTNRLQMLLGLIAAVSLLVAAIGIANTMVMSVYERSKEIAVMKVLGCKLGNIRSLFLFEAGLIGFFGGAVGIGCSFLASHLFNKYGADLMGAFGGRQWSFGQEMPPVSIIPVWLTWLGLSFSTVVGVIFGIFPAIRAMRLSVLQAIHN